MKPAEREELRKRFVELAEQAVAEVERSVVSGATKGGIGGPPPVLPEHAVEVPPRPQFGPYHLAAAVLSTFDPARLPGLEGAGDDPAEARNLVLADSDPVAGPDGTDRWALRTEIRRRVLAEIGSAERIEALLAANKAARPSDHTQLMFEAYLRGTAPPLTVQDRLQVTSTFEVAQWLADLPLAAKLGIPSIAEIRARNDFLALLQPFVDLAGTNFAGRTRELQRLRDHVGVLPPGSVGESIGRVAREVFNLHDKPPLVVYGAGGVGKSALISRFIWEHTTLDAERFPYGYIDFDRPKARAEEPLTILVEVVRQLGLQYPDAREFCDGVRQTWQRELVQRASVAAGGRSAAQSAPQSAAPPSGSTSGPQDWMRYLADFSRLLGRLRVESSPFLLVLDTFEEVQYRSDVVVAAIGEFLRIFQSSVPRLRVVIAGRSAIEIAGFGTTPMPLGDFDDAAARAYLAGRGVEPPELAASIVKRFGRSPLSLSLAATAWEQAGRSGALEDVTTRTRWGRSLTAGQIQGQLYRRILSHIHTAEVQQLAYPGLVLRRITPDIIRHVLAGPCKVDVPDDATARRLFDELAREVSLVRFEDGALVHRRDVRRVMLQLLRESDQRDTIREIEEAAVAYYSAFDTPVERAEEIYHRLTLRQPLEDIAARWLEGVDRYLYPAIDEDELEPRERAWLASRLGRSLDADEQATADLSSWEWDTERRVRDLLARNQVARALEALHARADRSPASPLFVLEAEAFERQKRWDEARTVLGRAIDAAAERGDANVAVDLLVRAAGHDLRLGDVVEAERKLAEGVELLRDIDDPSHRLEIALTHIAIAGARGQHVDAEAGREDEAREAFDLVPDAALVADPALARWAAAELGPSWPPVFQRVLIRIGLGSPRRRDERALGRAIAEWDDGLAREANRWPSVLASDIPYGETLTQAWTALLQRSSAVSLGERLARLLASYQPTPDVVDALAEIMRTQAGGLATWEPELAGPSPGATGDVTAPATSAGDDAPVGDVGLRLTGPQTGALMDALADAFRGRREVGEFLDYRLGRTIDSITVAPSMAAMLSDVVLTAQKEGWLGSFVVAALESRPGNAKLQAFAEEFGLTALGQARPELSAFLSSGAESIDQAAWRARLGIIEGQICRISVGGSDGPTVFGTGFLIGGDVVLTAQHVVQEVIEGRTSPRAVTLLFDFRRLSDGVTVTRGTAYRLVERRWLLDSSAVDPAGGVEPAASGPEGLDYALLRVAGAPGGEPIGGERAEPGAPPRGWLEPGINSDLSPGAALVTLHYGDAGPLTAGFGRVVGLSDDGTRIRYRLVTSPGSAGAPCFDARLNLIAVQQAREADGIGSGLLMSSILQQLEAHGLLASLGRRTV